MVAASVKLPGIWCFKAGTLLGLGFINSLELSSKLLKGDYIGEYIGDDYRVIKGDTRSLAYGSFSLFNGFWLRA